MTTQPDFGQFSEVATEFEENAGALWLRMCSRPVACYSPTLLDQLGEVTARVLARPAGEVRWLVLASTVKGVFNFGGDLALFSLLAKARDRAALIDYGHKCLERVLFLVEAPRNGLITIALVQGDALGGGLESALAAQVVVAERGAQLGFPEVLFNLFPGMGGWPLATRRAGRKVAADLVLSGAVFSAEELFKRGLVDILAEPGQGEAEVRRYVERHSARAQGLAAAYAAELDALPVDRRALHAVVERWADAALQITERDRRFMQRLVREQLKKSGGFAQVGAVEAIRGEVDQGSQAAA